MSGYPPQPYILQSGTITPGHALVWVANGVVGDSGSAPVDVPSAPEGYYFTASGLPGQFIYIEPNVAGGPAILDANNALSEQLVIPAGTTIALSLATIAASQVANGIPAGSSGALLGLTGVAGIGQSVTTLKNLTIAANASAFPTVAAFRAYSGTFTDGQIFDINAGTTSGDGQGGRFTYVAASMATDDGAEILKQTSVSGAGRAVRVNRNTYFVADYGINGGSSDATNLQSALTALKSKQFAKLDLSNLSSSFASGVSLSYTGSGQLSPDIGVFLSGPANFGLSGTITFLTIAADLENQQGGLMKISDMVFQGPGNNNQTIFSATGLANISLENIYALNTGPAVAFNRVQGGRVRDFKAFGSATSTTSVAFSIVDGYETVIDSCHAYGYGVGFYIFSGSGSDIFGVDGDIHLDKCISNGNGTSNYHIVGQYTFRLTNSTGEQSPYNIIIESCPDCFIDNLYCGPCTVAGNPAIQFLKNTGVGLNNDYCLISNVNSQNRWDLNYLNFARITNCQVNQLPSGAGTNAIQMYNCSLTSLENLLLQNTANVTNSLYIDGATCNRIAVYNGSYGNPIVIGGTLAQRVSGSVQLTHTITPDYCPAVVSSDASGLFFPGDVIRYFNGTQMMENQQGFLVPYSTSAMSFTVVYGTPQNFNCASLFTNLAGITQTQAYEATFVVVGGYAGSCAVVNLVYMQNANSSGLSITSSVGNGSGSLTVSVSGTTITMTNSDGISGQNSPVKITLTSLKLIA